MSNIVDHNPTPAAENRPLELNPPAVPPISPSLAAWNEFSSPAAWSRSAKNNLWRDWKGVTLTIFKKDDGTFGWCIAGPGGATNFGRGHATEWDAMVSVSAALGVGW